MLLMKKDGPKWREHLPKTQSFSNLMLHGATYVKSSDKDSETSAPTGAENEKAVEPSDMKTSRGCEKSEFESEESEKALKQQQNTNDVEGKEDTEKSKEKFKKSKDLGNKSVQKVSKSWQEIVLMSTRCRSWLK